MANSRDAEWTGLTEVAELAKKSGAFLTLDVEALEVVIAGHSRWVVWPGNSGWFIRRLIDMADIEINRMVAPFFAQPSEVVSAALDYDQFQCVLGHCEIHQKSKAKPVKRFRHAAI